MLHKPKTVIVHFRTHDLKEGHVIEYSNVNFIHKYDATSTQYVLDFMDESRVYIPFSSVLYITEKEMLDDSNIS